MRIRANLLIGSVLLGAMIVIAVLAPYLGTVNPVQISPIQRLRPPSSAFWFGTDMLGRDVYSRVIYGARVSIIVGLCVCAISALFGMLIGVVSGFFRSVDIIVMRIVDGMMAIPAILVAILLVSLMKGSIVSVIVAITIAEIPRMSRVTRGVVLSLRERLFIDAALVSGSSPMKIITRHVIPNAVPALVVQATYVCAAAMIIEASLSFIGAGTPPTVPSWGNIMSEGRAIWQIKPFVILFPALFLSATAVAVNLIGDGLRDVLDPRTSAVVVR